MKIIHTADWHLGTFPGPEKGGENARYLDLCDRLAEFVEQMEEEKPDAIIIAGDIFHQARTWSERGLNEVQAIIETVRKLEKICSVIIVRGTPNHDGANHYRLLETAFLENNQVKVLTVPEVVTLHTDNGDIQVAGLPGFDRGYFRSVHPGLSKEQEDEALSDAVNAIVSGLRAQCKADTVSILAGHYTIAGADMNGGQTAFFSRFEPVIEPNVLKQAGFDLVCFGHLHNPQKVEGADNVFYSGALSQLNFNDEGQKRGYYIHEIEGNEVRSTFREMKGLKFKTISLNDNDVTKIIEGGIEIEEDLTGKVVRVIYSCTDEHNKAFDHATLERALLKAGAFWVQEIVPEKITITVDKRSLDAQDSPEANLLSYLAERKIADDEINRIMGLAKPIIDKATENFSNDREHGKFVPVEIEVWNYRNYSHEKFNFDDVRFCTINGENGAGKSSLFMDAMLDALFEETREGDLTGWINNDLEVKSGSIVFTFKLGEKLFRVSRSRSKKGRATLALAEYQDGAWINRGKEKLRETQNEINSLLGIDSMTLKACALIMQDQYGLFLQADKEQRMAVLGNILGLGLYDLMEEETRKDLSEVNRRLNMAKNSKAYIEQFHKDSKEVEGELNQVKEQITEKEKTILNLQDELEVAKEDERKISEAKERLFKLNRKINEAEEDRNRILRQKTRCWLAINEARNILDKEEWVKEALEKRESLMNERQELSRKEEQRDFLENRISQIKSEISRAERVLNDNLRKAAELESWKIKPLERLLEDAALLQEKHERYEEAKTEKEIMEEYRVAWQRTQDRLASLEKRYNAHVAEQEKELAGMKAQAENLQRQEKLLETSNCPFVGREETGCIFLKDAIKAKESLPKVLEDIHALEALMELQSGQFQDAAQDELQMIMRLEKTYDPVKFRNLSLEINELEESEKEYLSLSAKQKELELYQEQLEELNQAVDESKDEFNSRNDELQEAFEERKQFFNLDAEQARIDQELALTEEAVGLEYQIPLYREREKQALERVSEIDREIEKIVEKTERWRVERTEAAKIARSDFVLFEDTKASITRVEGLENRIQSEQESLRELERTRGITESTLQNSLDEEKEIQDWNKKIEVECQNAVDYDILKKAFSPDGVPHNIIRSIVPLLESSATNILGQMSGGRMAVEFVTDKILKSNKKEVNTLDIVINDADTGRLPYKSRSGGEKVKAALSVILALSEVKQKRAGIQFGFLMIDEAPFLDAPATQAYCDALEAIQDRYSDVKVMAITHDESFKARFPQSVTVYKDQNGSHVRLD